VPFTGFAKSLLKVLNSLATVKLVAYMVRKENFVLVVH
jgi:hypothetical protein